MNWGHTSQEQIDGRGAGRPRIAAWIASPRRRPFAPLPS
jgi:hypothetical protein